MPATPKGTLPSSRSCQLKCYRTEWRVESINPAAVDLPLTEACVAAILMNTSELTSNGVLPAEAWILPVALFGGALQINLREAGVSESVEREFLLGMQSRGYGLLSLLGHAGWAISGRWRRSKFNPKTRNHGPRPWNFWPANKLVPNQPSGRGPILWRGTYLPLGPASAPSNKPCNWAMACTNGTRPCKANKLFWAEGNEQENKRLGD